jgi:hypothetical protein
MRVIRLRPRLEVQRAENVQVVLVGARKIGVKLSNVGAEDIMKGSPHICLSLIWQIIKVHKLYPKYFKIMISDLSSYKQVNEIIFY